MDRPRRWRAQILLASGAVLGILLATAGSLRLPEAGRLPKDAIARVNERIVRTEEFARALALLAKDKRNPLTAEDRARVLDRLIEEELLIQRGVELGFLSSERTVRKAIATAMLDSILVETRSRPASDAELRRFLDENRAYFTPPGSVRVQQLLFRTGSDRGDAAARARRARDDLERGVPPTEVEGRYADPPVHPLPDSALLPRALREYVGPSAVVALAGLPIGEWSEPLISPYGVQLLHLVDRTPARLPEFDEIRSQVVTAHARDAGDRALREYLDDLRSRAQIQLSAEAPR